MEKDGNYVGNIFAGSIGATVLYYLVSKDILTSLSIWIDIFVPIVYVFFSMVVGLWVVKLFFTEQTSQVVSSVTLIFVGLLSPVFALACIVKAIFIIWVLAKAYGEIDEDHYWT